MWEVAMRLWLAGKYEEAVKHFLAVVTEEPMNEQAYYYVAACYDELGKALESVRYYEKAIALGIDVASAYIGLGNAYRLLGRLEDARKILEKGRERFPEHHAIPPFLALVYNDLGLQTLALQLMLKGYVEASNDQDVKSYRRAILQYADTLHLS